MKNNINEKIVEKVKAFRLPRYEQLPSVGLYLEQVTQYTNEYLRAIGCGEVTSSMISNYVKKGAIPPPVKKQYYPEHIAHIIFISFAKNILSIDKIAKLFDIREPLYDPKTAYNYFCCEFENMLWYVYGLKNEPENIGVTSSQEKTILRSVIIAVSHMIFVNNCATLGESGEKAQSEIES